MSISPTSFALLQRCPRAWFYQYVARRPRVSTFALDNGTAVHAAVETYLRDGSWPEGDAPAIVQARRAQGVLDAWATSAGLRSGEGWAELEAAARIDLTPHGGVDVFAGRVDWHGSAPGPADGAPWVIDHKTTANPAFWGTPESLATNAQLLGYAGALFPGRDVTVGHLYIPPPPAEPTLVVTTAPVPAAAIEAALAEFAAGTVAAAHIRTRTDPEAVEARTAGCWAFGGCQHADVCTAAPEALRRRHHTHAGPSGTETPMALTPAQLRFQARLRGETVPDETPVAATQDPGAPADAPIDVPVTPAHFDALAPAGVAELPCVSVTPPDAPAPSATPDEGDPAVEAERLANTLVVPTKQKTARAVLCGLLGIRAMTAARWARVVEAGRERFWAVHADGTLMPVKDGRAVPAPGTPEAAVQAGASSTGTTRVHAVVREETAQKVVAVTVPMKDVERVVRAEVAKHDTLGEAWARFRSGEGDECGTVSLPLYLYDALVAAYGSGR